MPSSSLLPDGVSQEQLLLELRRLSWGAADILRAYARGEQPPYGFPKALSVDDGGEGPRAEHEAHEEHFVYLAVRPVPWPQLHQPVWIKACMSEQKSSMQQDKHETRRITGCISPRYKHT